GINAPVLVGGAALTRKFTKERIAMEYDGPVIYAKDAMNGLDIANQLSDPEQRQQLIEELRQTKESVIQKSGKKEKDLPEATRALKSDIVQNAPVFTPPDLDRHILRDYPITHLIPYINMQMLLGHHLGLRGSVEQLL